MELFEEILIHTLKSGEIKITFPGKDQDLAKIVEGECYKALQKIKAIIEDDRLDDPNCFLKIEEIVCVLEEIDSNGGARHDFG